MVGDGKHHSVEVVGFAGDAARIALAGLPYSGQDAEIDDGTAIGATVSAAGDRGWRIEVPGGGAWALPGAPVPLDRSAVNRVARPMPPPRSLLVVSGVGRVSGPVTIPEVAAAGVPVEHVNLGPSMRMKAVAGIGELVTRARTARMVAFGSFDDPMMLARVVVQLTGSGVVCVLDATASPPGLDPRLVESLRLDLALVGGDDLEWAAALARQSRAVWLAHDLQLRWEPGEGSWNPTVSPSPLPPVSVLLASRRPELVPGALRCIASQRSVDPEVMVALHVPPSQSIAPVEAAMDEVGLPGRVLRFEPSVPLGGILNVIAERAAGSHVTKWDDDDLYGPHHLEDLVVASRHSGADLIGKRAEFIHFEGSGDTVMRTTGGAEKRAGNVAGATLFTRRDLLLAVGGFPPLPKSVDFHLRRRYQTLGHSIYRTHGFGFVLVRRADDHTWAVSEEKLRTKAEHTWVGVPPIADVTTTL